MLLFFFIFFLSLLLKALFYFTLIFIRYSSYTILHYFCSLLMGVPQLWQLLRQQGYEATLLWQFLVTPPPPGSFYRVDILAYLFSAIERIYTSPSHEQQYRHIIFEQHLQSCRVPKNAAVLYIDGPSPDEKLTTRDFREAKRVLALQKAQTCIRDMEERLEGRRRLQKRDFSKLRKLTRAAFYWSLESRKSLAEFLAGMAEMLLSVLRKPISQLLRTASPAILSYRVTVTCLYILLLRLSGERCLMGDSWSTTLPIC